MRIPQRRIMRNFVPGDMSPSTRQTYIHLIYISAGDGLWQLISIPKMEIFSFARVQKETTGIYYWKDLQRQT